MSFTSFEEISDNYRAIFFDAFGVLKNSERVFQGVPELILALQESGKEIFVVTNDSSKSPERLAKAYEHPTRGPVVSPNRVISSGSWSAVKTIPTIGSSAIIENTPRITYARVCSPREVTRRAPRSG